MLRSDHLGLVLALTVLVVAVLLGLFLYQPDVENLSQPEETSGKEATVEPRRVENPTEVVTLSQETVHNQEEVSADEPEGLIEAASLTLEFRCQERALVSGIEIELLAQFKTKPRIRFETSNEDGVVVFRNLEAGLYRWRHDGQLDIVPVPMNEVAGMAVEDGKVAVHETEGRSSGPLELEAGEARHIVIPFQPAATITGRVVDSLGTLASPMALKLISRESFVHPGGTEVLRIVARQVGRFGSGEFRFERVRPGEMELLGYFNDEQGISQLRHEFQLSAGETRDLGALSVLAGRNLTVELKARAWDGRDLDWSEIYAADDLHRVVEIVPVEPDASWAYQKIEVPLGKSFELRGLGDCAYELRFAVEDALLYPPREGWQRLSTAALALEPIPTQAQVLHEEWRRVCRLRVVVAPESPVLDSSQLRLYILNLEEKSSQLLELEQLDAGLDLRLPEGRYRLLLSGEGSESVLCADSKEFRLGQSEQELMLRFEPAGRLTYSLAASGHSEPGRLLIPALGLGLELPRRGSEVIHLDLPPGRYEHEGTAQTLVLEPGQSVRLKLP